MIKKNEQQLNYLYGKEGVEILKNSIEECIRNGNYVTIPIESLDHFDSKWFTLSKIMLKVKKFFNIFKKER